MSSTNYADLRQVLGLSENSAEQAVLDLAAKHITHLRFSLKNHRKAISDIREFVKEYEIPVDLTAETIKNNRDLKPSPHAAT